MENTYLTPKQCAEITGLSKETILKWCRSGALKAFKPGGKYLIKREDLDAFITGHPQGAS